MNQDNQSLGDFAAFGGQYCDQCRTQLCFLGLDEVGDEIHGCACGNLHEIRPAFNGPYGNS